MPAVTYINRPNILKLLLTLVKLVDIIILVVRHGKMVELV